VEKENVSNDYLDEAGVEYFRLFTKGLEHGRLFQCGLFRPYCGDDRVILDYGCADGFSLRHLPASERIGVEVNPTAREHCRRLCEEEAIPIDLHDDPAGVPDARVDTVFSNHVLEHIPHPLTALRHMLRILKPGGQLVLVVPFDDWRQANHKHWSPDEPNHHLYTWSPLNIGNLLAEAGFDVQKVSLRTFMCHPRLTWIDRRLGRAAFRAASVAFAFLTNRRETLCLARKPKGT
jgi:SAM-dependent methyltransferase